DELEVGIGADGVDVEEIRHAELAEAEFEAVAREFFKERKEAALVLDFVVAEREDFVKQGATEIRRLAERRVADGVEVSVAGEAKALGQGGATSLLDVNEQFGRSVESDPGVERHHPRGCFLVVRAQAVFAGILCWKVGMGLEYEVRLAGKPEA